MCETLDMMEAANDNEPLTFTRIGLHAALVLNKLRNSVSLLQVFEEAENSANHIGAEKEGAHRIGQGRAANSGSKYVEKDNGHRSNLYEKKNEDAGADRAGRDTSEKDSDAHTRYVDQRLRELRAFEERAAGNKGTLTERQVLPRGRKVRG